MHLQYPVAVEMLQKFRERIEASKLLEVEAAYPIRVIGNRGIVNPENLPESALSKHLETLEKAILAGELLELARRPRSSRFAGQIEGQFLAYPIQIVFHNIGWYLGYEVTAGEKAGLLEFERLDKLCLLSKKSQTRSPVEQKQALDRLTTLYKASPGIFLGKSAEDQRKYLDPKRRKSVEMKVELWMGDEIFQFFIEGNQRFAKKHSLYTLEKSGDREFPNRFQVKLPKWSIRDVDLKRWIIGFGGKVKVVKPEQLVEMIEQEGEEIVSNYGKS
ncbi:MAG: WYL domain-containing protein [Hormoscilla sp. GM7CHS1pb]|nr:WYL domain-containing protein [Hormoscilla sp. GM7CHS1pb]